ncbi:fibulin-1 isoform 2 [Cricetulus griseus]|nr:fibulin-1 isoform 2 [Cricetulus griseus]
MERPAPSRPVPLPLLLLSSFSLLAARVNADISMEACCTEGNQMANQHRDCSLPYTSESKECRMVQEQCCHNQLEELHCATGINLASEPDGCATLPNNSSLETVFIKRCCHCCVLGRAAQARGQTCEPNLMISYQCGLVFRACCVKGQESSDFPRSDGGDPQDPAKIPDDEEQEDPYLNDRCRGGGPCKQQCRDTGDEVVCSCFVGYQLQSDGVSCEDINECITGSHNCRLGESCINTVGSFRCQRDSSCGTGYELTEDNNCKDIDECESGIHNCPPDFICQNTLGSFRCRPKLQCKSGFIQDALGNCIAEPCGKGHNCLNSPGSFRCECKAGYYFDGISRTCVDINECQRYPGRLCGHKCENTPGSYHCSCSAGFRLSVDGRSCEDVNECLNSPCSQECANVYGSYQCYCRRGYQLSDVDGVTCEDIDECALPTGGHICSYRCINIPGSFQCSCPSSGYRLAPNGRNCQDIDECVTGIHNCSINETCFNIQGSFRCLSFECPENYRRSADTRCERLPCHENPECPRLPLRITYYHLSFPTNIQVPAVVFRMGPSSAVPGDSMQLAITAGNEEGFFTTRKLHPFQNWFPNSFRQEKTDTVRCIKSCRPTDEACVRDPVHTISHTVISLPTFREFSRPEEIIFLRAVTPLYPANQADIIFDITEGNLRDSFDIIKRYEDSMTVGVVRQVRPIVGPFYAVLRLEMNYVLGGVISHRNVVNVHIFVSEFWF